MIIPIILIALSQEFIPFFGPASTGNHLRPDLIASWPMDGTDTLVTDASGNARHLSVNGSVPVGTTGIVGASRPFDFGDGLVNYLYVASDSALSLKSTPFTITAWANFTSRGIDPNDKTIICKGTYGGGNMSWWLFFDHSSPDDHVYFIFSGDGTYAFPDASKELVHTFSGSINNNYYFLVVRWDGTTLKLSVTENDGINTVPEADDTKAFAGPFYTDTTQVIIGANLGSTVHHMGGDLDEINIWNRELADCELKWLFQARLGTFSTANFDTATCVAP